MKRFGTNEYENKEGFKIVCNNEEDNNKEDPQCITCKRCYSGSCNGRLFDGEECSGHLKLGKDYNL